MKTIKPNIEKSKIIQILDNAAVVTWLIYGNNMNDMFKMLIDMKVKYFDDLTEKYIKLNKCCLTAIRNLITFYFAVTKPELDKIDEKDLHDNLEKYFIDACNFLQSNQGQADIFYKISSTETIYFLMKYMEYIKNGGK